MKSLPTVNEAELTLVLTRAKPVIVVLPAASVVLTLAKPVDVMPVELAMKLEPTVCEAALTLVLTLANPVIVVLPAANVVIPDTAPANVPVAADMLLAIVTLLLVLLNVNPADPFELVESLNCMCVFDPPIAVAPWAPVAP
jgi:hypothetical protein